MILTPENQAEFVKAVDNAFANRVAKFTETLAPSSEPEAGVAIVNEWSYGCFDSIISADECGALFWWYGIYRLNFSETHFSDGVLRSVVHNGSGNVFHRRWEVVPEG